MATDHAQEVEPSEAPAPVETPQTAQPRPTLFAVAAVGDKDDESSASARFLMRLPVPSAGIMDLEDWVIVSPAPPLYRSRPEFGGAPISSDDLNGSGANYSSPLLMRRFSPTVVRVSECWAPLEKPLPTPSLSSLELEDDRSIVTPR